MATTRLNRLRLAVVFFTVFTVLVGASVAYAGLRWSGIDPNVIVDDTQYALTIAVPTGQWCKIAGPVQVTLPAATRPWISAVELTVIRFSFVIAEKGALSSCRPDPMRLARIPRFAPTISSPSPCTERWRRRPAPGFPH